MPYVQLQKVGQSPRKVYARNGVFVVTLYEPVTLTWILISLLILLFSGTLLDDALTKHQRSCYARNAELLEAGRHGPLMECEK
jgi:hypothetical protein